MSVSGDVADSVRERAGGRCQYCMMHQSLQGATFHIEHIIPRAKGGVSDLTNLALACPGCNLRKGDRTAAVDPLTGEFVPLFNPARQVWSEHFRFNGVWVEGLTPIGRATVSALDLNHPRRRRIRAVEERLGLFPGNLT